MTHNAAKIGPSRTMKAEFTDWNHSKGMFQVPIVSGLM
jgi:hypothetical protein